MILNILLRKVNFFNIKMRTHNLFFLNTKEKLFKTKLFAPGNNFKIPITITFVTHG